MTQVCTGLLAPALLKHSVAQFPVHGYFDPRQSRKALHLASSDVLLSLQSLQAVAVPQAYPLPMTLLMQLPPPSIGGRPASVDVVPPAPDTPPLAALPPEPLTPPVVLLPPAAVTPPDPVLPPEPTTVVPPVAEAVVPPVDTIPPVPGVPPASVPQQNGGMEPPLLLT